MGDNRWFKAWGIPEGHWLRADMKYLGAWYDLIGLAEWQEGVKVKRGKMFGTKRGVVYMSVNALAERWGWTWRTTKHFLSMLEMDGMAQSITQNGEQNVFISNYAKYQDTPQNREQNTEQSGEQNTRQNRQQNTEQNRSRFLPNKEEGKEYKDVIERESKRETARFTPPTLSEVLEYITEKGYAVDGRRFWEYYESIGWKVGRNRMKDWKAAVRSWNARDEQERKQRSAPQAGRFNNFEAREPGTSLMDDYIKLLEA